MSRISWKPVWVVTTMTVAAAGDEDFAAPIDACDQQIVLQRQFRQGNAVDRRAGANKEFRRLDPVVEQLVEGFNVGADGVLQGADVGNDGFRRDEAGVDDAAQIQLGDDVAEGNAVELGDGLGPGDPAGVKGHEDVFLVDAREGNEGIGAGDALLLQELLVGAVAVQNGGLRKQFAEFGAALGALFDDFDVDAHLQKLTGQVIAGSAAADDHRTADLMGGHADAAEEAARILGRNQHRYLIALAQHGAAAGDAEVMAALQSAEQRAALQILGGLRHGLFVQAVSLGNAEFDQLRRALGKGVDIQGRGQTQKTRDLRGGFQIGIDDHAQTQLLAQEAALHGVVRVADAGDGGAVAGFFGQGAAQQVQLIRAGDRDHQIRALHAGLLLQAVTGAVAR